MPIDPSQPVRAAVFGKPIGHSLSPQLFRLMWQQQGRVGDQYLRIQTDRIDVALEMASLLNLAFANITHPLKRAAFQASKDRTPVVDLLEAANRLDFTSADSVTADNTDPDGVRYALRMALGDSQPRGVLIAGAGGAAAAALVALRDWHCDIRVALRNRIVPPHLDRIRDFSTVDMDQLIRHAPDSDLIIWTIPEYPEKLALPMLKEEQLVLDAQYGTVRAPQYFGHAQVINGLDWLAGQGMQTYQSLFGELAAPDDTRNGLFRVAGGQSHLKNRHIALIGFMGAGKTTVPWMDVDHTIEVNVGRTISDIFTSLGEQRFRELEKETVLTFPEMPRSIISLGGGAPVQQPIRDWLKEYCTTIWLLRTPLPDFPDPRTRPMLHLHDPAVLFTDRVPIYADVADIVTPVTDQDTPEQTAHSIVLELDR